MGTFERNLSISDIAPGKVGKSNKFYLKQANPALSLLPEQATDGDLIPQTGTRNALCLPGELCQKYSLQWILIHDFFCVIKTL